jgi:hypothetical protein
MDKAQEKELKKIYDREVKVVGKTYERRFGVSLKTAMGALQTPARGRRGGGGPRRPESLQVSEARRLSTQLVDQMVAALRVFDQQGPLRRHQAEQIRLTKLNTLIISTTQSGTPLTAEQITQAEAILARESRLRPLMIVEAKGDPLNTQVLQLEAQTAQRLVALLDEVQKVAYATATSPAPATRTMRIIPRTTNP